jgi:hypothetical protein
VTRGSLSAAFAAAEVEIRRWRGIESHARCPVESPERVLTVERARPAAGLNIVAIVDTGPVVAAGQRQVKRASERERVGGKRTPGGEHTIEIDSRVERFAVDLEKAQVLKALPGEQIVGVSERQRQVAARMPPELSEQLRTSVG